MFKFAKHIVRLNPQVWSFDSTDCYILSVLCALALTFRELRKFKKYVIPSNQNALCDVVYYFTFRHDVALRH